MVSLYDEYLQAEPLSISMDSEILSLRKFEWSKDDGQVIRKIAVANNTMVVALGSTCSIIRRNLDAPAADEDVIEISKRKEDVIEHVFLDPTGHHAIIALSSGDNYYLHSRSTRPKKFSKLQGGIEAVAFDRRQSAEGSTKAFLAGTAAGCVYELCLESNGKEKTCTLLHTLPEPLPITSIHFDSVAPSGSAGAGQDKAATQYFVMLATAAPTRLYHFLGSGSLQQTFAAYANSSAHDGHGEAAGAQQQHCTELPGELARVELLCFNNAPGQLGRSQTFALMTQVGIYQGSLVFTGVDAATGRGSCDVLIESSMPYDESGAAGGPDETPLSIAATKLHFLTLQYDRLLCISRLNGSLVQEERLSVADGSGIGLVQDPLRNSIWLFTDSLVYQVVIMNEDKHVWAIYLGKAQAGEERMFEKALEHCKRPQERAVVMKARADHALSATPRRAQEAALYFAQAGTPFEEVIMLLLGTTGAADAEGRGSRGSAGLPLQLGSYAVTHGTELSALRIYLLDAVEVLPHSAKSQRTMVCTWLCEIFLHQVTMRELADERAVTAAAETNSSSSSSSNGGGDADADIDTRELVEQFKGFLDLRLPHLDVATTLSLITMRGRGVHRELLLYFAQLVNDYDRIVSRLVSDRQITEALHVLDAASVDRVQGLVYKFAPITIQSHPRATVDMLLSKPELRVSGVLPALLRYANCLEKPASLSGGQTGTTGGGDDEEEADDENYAVTYLQDYVRRALAHRGGAEAAAFHSLLWLLAKYGDEAELDLCNFLMSLHMAREEPFYASWRINAHYMLRQCQQCGRKRGVVHAYLLCGLAPQAVQAALEVDMALAKQVAQGAKEEERKGLWLTIAQHVIKTDADAKRALLLLAESEGALKIEDLLPLLPDFTEIELFKEEICSTLEDCGSRIDQLKSEMWELSESAESINTELESMKRRGYSVSSLQRCEYCPMALFNRQFYLFPCSHGFHNDCLLARVHEHRHLEPPQLEVVAALEEQIHALSRRSKDDKRALTQQEYLQNELDGYVAADCPLCGYVMIRSLAMPLVSDSDAKDAETWEL